MTGLVRKPRLKWEWLVPLTNEELVRYDIAAVNLACAVGLPGADQIDHDYCLYKLDDWADCVKEYTARLTPQFRRKPQAYENSEAYFRALCLITVLQRDMGVKYNEAKRDESAPFDTEDSFIHGVIHGSGGTCTTMPVVYVAVGRRLGYPMKLVSTRGKVFSHSFARWEDPQTGERFNIEATNKGLSTPSDDYYHSDPFHPDYRLTPEVEKQGCYLVSKTPRMELAAFLAHRAWRWEDVRNWRECVHAWACAVSLVPEDQLAVNTLKRCMLEWDKELRAQKPLGFPTTVHIRAVTRQYPDSLPLELERDICGLTAVHNLLTDPRLEERHWARMRRDDTYNIPVEATATFAPDNSCHIELRIA